MQLYNFGKYRTQKFTNFIICSILLCEKTNLSNFFHSYVLWIQVCVKQAWNKCSKCHPYAPTHATSLFLHSFTAESMIFCCRPFQTSTKRCFSSSTLFKRYSCIHSKFVWRTLWLKERTSTIKLFTFVFSQNMMLVTAKLIFVSLCALYFSR